MFLHFELELALASLMRSIGPSSSLSISTRNNGCSRPSLTDIPSMIPRLIEWPASIFCTSSSSVIREGLALFLQSSFDTSNLFARGLFIIAQWIYVYSDFLYARPHLSALTKLLILRESLGIACQQSRSDKESWPPPINGHIFDEALCRMDNIVKIS